MQAWVNVQRMRSDLIAMLALVLAASAVHAGGASFRVLSRTEASKTLTGVEAQGYYGQLQLADVRAKTGLPLEGVTLEAARSISSRAYGAATGDFTDDKGAALRDAVESMQPLMAKRAPLYARTPWCFIKVNATIEGGLPHTRGDCIVLADSVVQSIAQAHAKTQFDKPSGIWDLLLHEQTHVVQRRNPALFAALYTKVYGFRQVEVVPPEWLLVRRVVNPDAPLVEWIFAVGQGAAQHWLLPDLELAKLNHPRMPADFRAVALGMHVVDSHRWALDDAATPAAQTDLDRVAEYVDAFPVKGEAFHPNEIAAEMLAEIIMGDKIQNPEHPLWATTRQCADKAVH